MNKKAEILMTEFVTHDVKRFVLEKPENYEFVPGQATEISINKEDWKEEKRPFTFTSLNSDLALEFIIKGYPEHNGVTEQLHELEAGEELIIREPWGTINYQGRGTFIAGGAGITPFIAIFRQLEKDNELKGNSLIFTNKEVKDVILEKELREKFGDNLILTLTGEEKEGYKSGRINKDFLEENIQEFSQNFYVCGPPGFVKDITSDLKELGADPEEITIEE